MEIQDKIDDLPVNGKLLLKPGEIKGPLYIRKPCLIEGNHTTLWNHDGPVVEINAPQVHLKSLRIEVSDNARNNTQTALKIIGKSTPILEDIEVRGLIEGMAEEAGTWDYPPLIDVSDILSNRTYEKTISIISPIISRIVSEMSGVSFSNNILQRGFNDVVMKVAPVGPNTIISGNIFIESKVRRRIRVHGIVGDVVPPSTTTKTTLRKSPGWKQLDKGEHISLPADTVNPKISLEISSGMSAPVRMALIYVSEKKADGTVGSEVSFSDIRPGDTGTSGSMIPILLKAIEGRYARLYILAGLPDRNGSSFRDCRSIPFRIWDDRDDELYLFDMAGENVQIMLIGELYRRGDAWRFKALGAGYRGDWAMVEQEYSVTIPR